MRRLASRARRIRGSGGMFVSSEKFIEAHSGKLSPARVSVPPRCLKNRDISSEKSQSLETLRENVRAQLRVLVKRILRKHGCPPDKPEKATQTVLEQAEV